MTLLDTDARFLELHERVNDITRGPWCAECEDYWPCRALVDFEAGIRP